MATRKNITVTTTRIPAMRLGELVTRIPSNVNYSLTQDSVRKNPEFATNVKLTLDSISPVNLGKIVAFVDVSTTDYSVKQV